MEFWETNFKQKQSMWGFGPADAAILTKDFFRANHINDVLIPGIGYGRNAKVFLDSGISVTGIEISQTAIDLAAEHGLNIKMFHGSVAHMPFEEKKYEGIFCYALLHLLESDVRKNFIEACYNQLKPNGYMIFTTISKQDDMYGQGKPLAQDFFERAPGLNMYFYDTDSIQQDFGKYGLVEISTIAEPNKQHPDGSALNFLLIKCQKIAKKHAPKA